MTTLGWFLLFIGLILVGAIIWVYKDYLTELSYKLVEIIKRNKKKFLAILTTTSLVGVGGGGLVIDNLPGSYVPTDQSLRTTDDVEFNNITIPDTINMSDATQTWHIYVNETGVLVWEMV